MNITMTGHDRYKTEYLSAAKLKAKGHKKGYFHTDTTYWANKTPMEVKFESTMYIDEALQGQAKTDVVTHEKRHFEDFKRLALAMRAKIVALRPGSNAQLEERIAWLLYDRCEKSNEFHRSEGGYGHEMCSKPDGPRPP